MQTITTEVELEEYPDMVRSVKLDILGEEYVLDIFYQGKEDKYNTVHWVKALVSTNTHRLKSMVVDGNVATLTYYLLEQHQEKQQLNG